MNEERISEGGKERFQIKRRDMLSSRNKRMLEY